MLLSCKKTHFLFSLLCQKHNVFGMYCETHIKIKKEIFITLLYCKKNVMSSVSHVGPLAHCFQFLSWLWELLVQTGNVCGQRKPLLYTNGPLFSFSTILYIPCHRHQAEEAQFYVHHFMSKSQCNGTAGRFVSNVPTKPLMWDRADILLYRNGIIITIRTGGGGGVAMMQQVTTRFCLGVVQIYKYYQKRTHSRGLPFLCPPPQKTPSLKMLILSTPYENRNAS